MKFGKTLFVAFTSLIISIPGVVGQAEAISAQGIIISDAAKVNDGFQSLQTAIEGVIPPTTQPQIDNVVNKFISLNTTVLDAVLHVRYTNDPISGDDETHLVSTLGIIATSVNSTAAAALDKKNLFLEGGDIEAVHQAIETLGNNLDDWYFWLRTNFLQTPSQAAASLQTGIHATFDSLLQSF